MITLLTAHDSNICKLGDANKVTMPPFLAFTSPHGHIHSLLFIHNIRFAMIVSECIIHTAAGTGIVQPE
jgi:hypothetical protein